MIENESYDRRMSEIDTADAGFNAEAAEYGAVLARARRQLEDRIETSPGDAEAWFNLGILSRDRGEYDRAELCFTHALNLRPDDSLASVELGLLRRKRGDLDAAAAWYRRAIVADPSSVNAHFNLGNWARDTEQYDEAEAEYRFVLRMQPNHYGALINIGYVYEQQVRYTEAMQCYKQALVLHPRQAGTLVNIGNLRKEVNDISGAIAAYTACLQLEPGSPEAHHSLALALLASGDYRRGWEEYEWRLRCSDTGGRIGVRVFPQPLWDGGPLEGKTIFVYGEQGLGDNIQFVRFLPELQRRGARVVFGCYRHLLKLFDRCKGADQVIDVNGDSLPMFDTYGALMSLPHLLGIQSPALAAEAGYLQAEPGRVVRWTWIRDAHTLTVGLVWASNTKNRHARMKSMAFDELAPILAIPDVTFYSLQIVDRGPVPDAANVVTLDQDISTLEETAAIIENLDLVVTVDTSIAHLAGALGKDVWTLLPYSADWRWPRSGEATPWYPGMRLFRQSRLGSWKEPVAEVAARLEGSKVRKLHG